jgi:hypothetical protein
MKDGALVRFRFHFNGASYRGRFAQAAACGGVLSLSGCDILNPIDCTAILVPGIVIAVVDASTSRPLRGPVRVIARDGSFADTAQVQFVLPPEADPDTTYHGPFALVYERAGTYDVSVHAIGYREWTDAGIRVTRDQCHVRTKQLEAALQGIDTSAPVRRMPRDNLR